MRARLLNTKSFYHGLIITFSNISKIMLGVESDIIIHPLINSWNVKISNSFALLLNYITSVVLLIDKFFIIHHLSFPIKIFWNSYLDRLAHLEIWNMTDRKIPLIFGILIIIKLSEIYFFENYLAHFLQLDNFV